MTSLCGAWWFSNTSYMTSAFLKVKESFSWKTLCHKRGSCLRRRPLARSRTKRILQCDNQANELQLPSLAVTSESTKPNDNELEVAYAFPKIFQPEICWNVTNRLEQFLRRSWAPFLRRFFLQRRTGKRKKARSLVWNISLSFGSIYERRIFYGGRKKVHQIDNEARLSRGSTVRNKHPRVTNLAFMQLVPGDERVVRHICIRCIVNWRNHLLCLVWNKGLKKCLMFCNHVGMVTGISSYFS